MSDPTWDMSTRGIARQQRGMAADLRDSPALPPRVIVDQHGHYWRDYGDHLSMPPVSDENVATDVAATFYLVTEESLARALEGNGEGAMQDKAGLWWQGKRDTAWLAAAILRALQEASDDR